MSGVLSWLSEPSGRRGVRFALPGDEWDFWSYQRLAGLTHRFARALADAGVVPGDVVAIVSRGGPGFVAALFGTMSAGATASPLPSPMVFGDSAAYEEHVLGALTTVRPAALVADACGPAVAALAARAGVPTVLDLDLLLGRDRSEAALRHERPGAAAGRAPGGAALVQFTSGSSGRGRGVRISHNALAANVHAIRGWLGMRGDRPTASWLPVHHDMGLTGCLITPIVDGGDLWLLSPEEFVHRPLRFLRCFGELGAQHTAMPTFGLAHVVRRVRPADLAGLDFSGWRAVIVGAERIDPGTLARFVDLLGPHGLRPEALLPAYGLAEATLAVTGQPMSGRWTAVRFDPASLAVGRRVRAGGDRPDHQPVVGCGRPLAGVEVTIAGDDGEPVPDGTVGEIVVRGASLGTGYVDSGAPTASLTGFAGDHLRTGDAGFLHDGELFVLGRLGDSLKVRARTVFAEDIEAAVTASGVPARRFAAVLGVRRGVNTAVGVVELARDGWLATAEKVLRRLADGAEVVVVDAPRGTIPRTSSGKPRRQALWRRFATGDLDATP